MNEPLQHVPSTLKAKTHKSFFDLEMEFADACDIYQGKVEGFEGTKQQDAISLAARLCREELVDELGSALYNYLTSPTMENKVEVADAIADSIYVLCQLARAIGIPLNEVYAVVHESNMAKVGAEGKVIRREDGKVLKPADWIPPEPRIWETLKAAADREAIALGAYGADNWPQSKG